MRRGPKINRQKNPAAREAWIKYKKERNALKPNPLYKVWHDLGEDDWQPGMGGPLPRESAK